MLSESFGVREFHYRDGERVEPFWGIVVRFGDDDERVIYETDRRGVATDKLHDLQKLLCDVRSEWRAKLPQGLDAQFGLWTFAVPLDRKAKIEQRKKIRRRRLPDWLAA